MKCDIYQRERKNDRHRYGRDRFGCGCNGHEHMNQPGLINAVDSESCSLVMAVVLPLSLGWAVVLRGRETRKEKGNVIKSREMIGRM